jgi:uncharacterized damage-inducible protein DinB
MVATWEEMVRLRTATDQRIAAWTLACSQDGCAGEFRWFASSTGRDMCKPASMVVTHFFNHQTHHRGQAHALLTRAGEDTGATDLVAILPG